ncbi:MAG: DUF4259 domain-containing protein [Planctomycetia bacterium]|nr:DUF4259 domain-containing protein [Planctomycetia bacterium]
MGAWGVRAFDNDTANDWAYGLDEVRDLSLVEAAFAALEAVGADFLEQDVGAHALAACEVLARLLGNPGYQDAYTEKVDQWVAAHPLKPSPKLLARAEAALDRVLGNESELREEWQDVGEDEWRQAVEELRQRLRPQR